MRGIFLGVLPALWSLLVPPPWAAASPDEPKRVLVLYSEDKDNPGHQLADEGLREGLQAHPVIAVRLYAEYLDGSRFGDPAHMRLMADFLRRKYAAVSLNAIITIYPAALDFLLAGQPTLFPGVPIIAAGIARRDAERLEQSPARAWVTGVIGGDNISGLLETALQLFPNTKHIALIAGTAPSDEAAEQLYRRGLEPYAGRIEVLALPKLPLDDIVARVAKLPPDTLVLYASIFRDGAGQTFTPPEALARIAPASTRPVFGFLESYLGFGIVGGRLASFKAHGREAAALLLRILNGESPAAIPFGGEQTYVSAFDGRELTRWRIPDRALPVGAEIRYRGPSMWQAYRTAVLTGLAVITLETGLILGLLVNYRRRRRVERILRQQEQDLRSLTGRLIATQEAELGRLSRDLHDNLTQRLAAVAIETGLLEKTVKPLDAQAAGDLAGVKARMIALSDEVHALSRQLHPSILDDLGVVRAVQAECEAFTKRTGIAVSCAPGQGAVPLPKDIALCLYRVLQEGLQNIAKHSGAGAAHVVLEARPDEIQLAIQDTGVGFDVAAVAGKGAIGLSNMRERVTLVGGTLTLVSAPGHGTTVRISIPLGGPHGQSTGGDRG